MRSHTLRVFILSLGLTITLVPGDDRRFPGALRAMAAERAATLSVVGRPNLRAWLIGPAPGRHGALLAAAVLLLIALPSALLVIATGRTRRELDQARLSAANWQRRYEDGQQAARSVEREVEARTQQPRLPRLANHESPVSNT
jgi:uncharacterized protein HemX